MQTDPSKHNASGLALLAESSGTILGGALLGWLGDQAAGTEVLILIGLFLGLILSTIKIYRQTQR
jgi:F0F1-type ATP synthase assembly protein I